MYFYVKYAHIFFRFFKSNYFAKKNYYEKIRFLGSGEREEQGKEIENTTR